jgi:glutathione S-transferase
VAGVIRFCRSVLLACAALREPDLSVYRLHYFPESGNSYKLALMLTLCGQDFEKVWTDFGSGVTWSAAWRRDVNPMGEIPVLEEDGARLTQTGPILLHLAAKFGRFGGRDEANQFEVLRWLFWDNQKLSGFMAMYRYRRAFTPSTDPAVLDFMRRRVDDFLGILEQRLTAQDFVVGTTPTVADLSMVGYLMFPAHESGYDLASSHKAVAAWLARIKALPGWAAPYDLLPGQLLRCYVEPA